MKSTLVSIVIPTKNCEKTIKGLMKSIKNLNYDKYEVIVVDSSNDKTPQIAKNFGARVVNSPSNKREANKARNIGVKEARGEIIAFTDGDCEVDKNWLKELVNGFEKNDIAIVGGSISALGNSFFKRYHDLAFRTGIPKINEEKVLSEKDFLEKQLFTKYELPVGMNMAIRKEIFKKVGYFDETMDYLEETELFWRILKKGYKIKCMPKARIFHNHADKLFIVFKKYFKTGKGVGIFFRKYPNSNFSKHRIALLIGFLSAIILFIFLLVNIPVLGILLGLSSLLPTLPHSIKVAREEKFYKAIFFPIFDVLLCGFTYHFGIIYGIIHGK
jgi:glycosyltransferase involved in cell wall biosynthesis